MSRPAARPRPLPARLRVPGVVVARVRARLRQPDVAPPQTLRAGGLEMDVRRRDVRVDGRPVELTPTEFSLLQVLMEQAGYVLTRGELTRRALGVDFEGVERTLDSHIRNLRQKLELSGFALRRISYNNFFLFPPVAAVRLLRPYNPGLASPHLTQAEDVYHGEREASPEPANTVLHGIGRLEAALLQRTALPFGVSVICLAEKPA